MLSLRTFMNFYCVSLGNLGLNLIKTIKKLKSHKLDLAIMKEIELFIEMKINQLIAFDINDLLKNNSQFKLTFFGWNIEIHDRELDIIDNYFNRLIKINIPTLFDFYFQKFFKIIAKNANFLT